MAGLKFEERALEIEESEETRRPEQDPLAGKRLVCPYCGWVYLPEEGCFCLRLVGWESASRPEPEDKEKRS